MPAGEVLSTLAAEGPHLTGPYSRMMGEDEAGTLARPEGLKAEILDPLIAKHHGSVFKLMGDGVVVEVCMIRLP